MAPLNRRLIEIIYTFTDKATKPIKSFNKFIDKTTKQLIRFSKVGFFAVAASIGTLILRLASLESKITDIGNLFGATKNELKSIQDIIVNIATATGISAKDLAEAEFDIVSATGEVSKSFGVLEASAKLAVAGFTDVTTAANLLTTGINVFGDEVKDATELSDKFFQAQVRGNTTIGKLGVAFGRVASIAKSADISLDELLGTISALTVKGINTNEAVTSLRAAISAIVKPTKQAKDEAKLLGIEFGVNAIKTKGFAGFLKSVTIAADGNQESLATLFGSVEALTAITALAQDGFQGLEETIASIEGAIGVTEKAFKEKSGNLTTQVNILKETFFSLGQSISFIIPILTKFVSGLTRSIIVVKAFLDSLSPDKLKRTNSGIKNLDRNIERLEKRIDKLKGKTKEGILGKVRIINLKAAETSLERLKLRREKLIVLSGNLTKEDKNDFTVIEDINDELDDIIKKRQQAITPTDPQQIDSTQQAANSNKIIAIESEKLKKLREMKLAFLEEETASREQQLMAELASIEQILNANISSNEELKLLNELKAQKETDLLDLQVKKEKDSLDKRFKAIEDNEERILSLKEFTTEEKIALINKELEEEGISMAKKQALEDASRKLETEQLKERTEQLKQFRDFFVDDVTEGVTSGNLNIGKSFKRLGQQIQRVIVKQALTALITKLAQSFNIIKKLAKIKLGGGGFFSKALGFIPGIGGLLSAGASAAGFQDGGIVPGNDPQSLGDKRLIAVQSGEGVIPTDLTKKLDNFLDSQDDLLTEKQKFDLFRVVNRSTTPIERENTSFTIEINKEIILLMDNGEELTRGISQKQIELKSTGQIDELAL